jgi:hypothetical protein
VGVHRDSSCRQKLVFGNQSAIPVWFRARLSSAKFAFLSRLGTTSRAADGKGLFYAAFLFRHSAL